MEIVKTEIDLEVVNKEIAFFNCSNKVSGVLHLAASGEYTVIIDGCYVLGSFDCSHCAIKAISLLATKIFDGENAGFGNYRSYKLDYSEQFFRTIH